MNALCQRIAPKQKIFLARATGIGNPVIYVGAKTGRDGIHGASLLASAEFDEASAAKRPNVQIGDPFLEKLLLEALLEALDTDTIIGFQDIRAERPAQPLAVDGCLCDSHNDSGLSSKNGTRR